MRALTPLLVDYLSVVADGPPEAHGFEQTGDYTYGDKSGWRAVQRTHRRSGKTFTYADLSGEDCAMRVAPMARWTIPVNISRIDVTRDVVGLPVEPGLAYMFAGTRKARPQEGQPERPSCGWRESRTGSTLYIGAPTSPLMLRVYTKHNPGLRLKALWQQGGWGGELVTRVEYQCRTRQVRRAVRWNGVTSDWREQCGALWDDALARVRLCSSLPSLFRQRNEAPTHPEWCQLAFGVGPRRLDAPAVERTPPSDEHMERAIERYLDKGGDMLFLTRLLASLAKVNRG